MNSDALVRIFFTRGEGLISWFIRFQTFGNYAHVGFLLPDGTTIEARSVKGVHRGMKPKDAEVYEISGLTADQSGAIIREAMKRRGSKYDYLAVLRFVSRRNSERNGRWFCSELVLDVCRAAGVNLLHPRTHEWRVSPSILPMSPLLEKCE